MEKKQCSQSGWLLRVIFALIAMTMLPFNVFSVSLSSYNTSEPLNLGSELPDSIPLGPTASGPLEVVEDEFTTLNDRVKFHPVDTMSVVDGYLAADTLQTGLTSSTDEWVPRKFEFNPDPTRAVWMAALFPGLGQLYNRRYWKLPLVVGGYLGLGYATNWNNTMLRDYTKAYADIMDNDPTTKSYMDFFPPTVKEEDLDKTWLTNVLQSRKNYFRRNRDLCIIGMIGVYLVAIVDAYVDASLAHFDISPDLSMEVYPSLIQDGRNRLPSIGLQWAVIF